METQTINKCMWEILVPATDNRANEISVRYHQLWDAKVRAITGGLTIMPTAKGEWVQGNEGKVVFREPMIPVRMWASREQMDDIAAMTMEHYGQLAVMFYLISTTVFLVTRTTRSDAEVEEEISVLKWYRFRTGSPKNGELDVRPFIETQIEVLERKLRLEDLEKVGGFDDQERTFAASAAIQWRDGLGNNLAPSDVWRAIFIDNRKGIPVEGGTYYAATQDRERNRS